MISKKEQQLKPSEVAGDHWERPRWARGLAGKV